MVLEVCGKFMMDERSQLDRYCVVMLILGFSVEFDLSIFLLTIVCCGGLFVVSS